MTNPTDMTEAPAPQDLGPQPASRRAVQFATVAFLGVLALLGYFVLRDFLVPLLWAGILTYVVWPLHIRMCRSFGDRRTLCSLITTSCLTVAIVLPISMLAVLLQTEIVAAYRALREFLASEDPLLIPEMLGTIPWAGEYLQSAYSRVVADPAALGAWLADRGGQWVSVAGNVIGAIGRNAFVLGIALVAVFFLLRDGEALVAQARRVLGRFLGPGYVEYWNAVAGTTRGVVYGLVLTALTQGALAGLGYWVSGTEIPVLLTALTCLLALFPFGAPLVWAPCGIWLVVTGELWAGVGLLIWGGVVVSWVDNILRPLAISSATRIPFLLVLIGVFGGLRAFGLVGLFAGPMVLAVLLAVWREWLEHQGATPDLDTMPTVTSHEPDR
jgi:predicted PurR-regulated permease PerM